MRRFLLTTFTLLMAVCMMAVGNGTGVNKANAIDFDWEKGNDHNANAELWYRVDLAPISGLVDPTLALYLTNLSDSPAKVDVDVYAKVSYSLPIPGFKPVERDTTIKASYTIDAKGYELWSENVKELMKLNVTYLDLRLSSTQKIKLSAKKYETSDIVDDACTKAKDFDWNGVSIPAGTTWYRLNLADVKKLNKELDFVVTNNGSKDAKVRFELSLDCPASTIWGYDWNIASGDSKTEEFGRFFIDVLKEDYVYLKLTSDQAINLKVEERVAPTIPAVVWNEDAILEEGVEYTFVGEYIFLADMATLNSPLGDKVEFVVINNEGETATVVKQISFNKTVTSTINKELKVEGNSSVTKEVVNNMTGVINSDKVYVRFTSDKEVTVKLNYVEVNPEIKNEKPVVVSTCENSELLNWNSTVKQSGLETKWYEIDLATIKQNDQHLQLSFTNKSDKVVIVMGEILRACGGDDTIPYILPVQPGETVSQVINYNLFALLPHPKHFYVSATVIPTTATSIKEFTTIRSKEDIMEFVPSDLDALQAAEVELTAKTISAIVDPTNCNQAVTIARGVKYEQAAGTTKWYRVTDELLNKLSLIPDIAFINNGKKAANITLAATVDCEHATFGLTSITVPTWADLTMFPSRLVGNLLDKAFNGDVKEMYLQVTTDQPIAFGIDINYGFGLGCDDARVFDWTKGAVIEAGDAQWLSFDIKDVKKNKQQVKLTLTNESNSLAWVGMMVSLTCPFDVALPTFFAIPAGMSIDKVVDYSYFAATKLDQLYIALITEEKISVKAEAVKSQSSPSDKLACQNAVEVKNGEVYVHKPGTTWYKFDRAMFSDVSRLPKFRYAAEATTNVTFGATVGCEYNIATHANIKFPSTRGLEVSFRTPGFITEILDKFVHQDVKEFYVELKTDKQIKFGMDMEYAGGCEKATKLDFSKPIDIDLKANKDVWYTINLKDFEKLGDKLISFNLNNPDDKAVEVEFELTPTCPLIVSAIKSVSVPAGVNMPLAFPASKIANLYDQVIAQFNLPEKIENNLPNRVHEYYVRIRANGDLSIDEGGDAPEVVEPGCSSATPLDITKPIVVDNLAKGWYVVDMTKIKKDFTLSFVNNSGSNQTLDFDFYKGCDESSTEMMKQNWLTSYNFVVPTTGFEQFVPYSMISSFITMDELYIYLNKEEGGEVDMACASAQLIDPTQPQVIELEAGKEQWFKVATNAFDNFEKNLVVSFNNLTAKNVKVDFSVATTCPALMTIDSTVTVKASYNRVDSITAGMINLAMDQYGDNLNGIDTAYIRVLANGALKLTVDTFTVVTPEMPEGCENAKDLDFSKTINLSTIQTGWYRVDLTPLKNGSIKKVSINNDLGKVTGVQFDIFRNCEQSSFLYTYTHAFEVGLFEQTIPSSALSMLGSLNELYIYITMDVDVLTCEDAIEFDWSKGAVHSAGDTQWYHFDITTVENNEQQVKLTFTNHSNDLAVVYGEVAMHCPYTKSIPFACVVPAGMSIDKVVDYSVFKSSRVEELYVKVTSTKTIELGATTESALVFDQTPCNNATLVETGVEYKHAAGTSWYKLPKSLFVENTGKLPKFYFTTEEEGLTKITLGATVGCAYNIATKTIVVLPGSLNYAMVVPEQMFDLMDKFVSDDVTEVYVEMTTDRAVHFSVDMINNTDDACHSAEALNATNGIKLEANQDKWYKIDFDALKAMNSDVAVTVINPSAEAVTVDMELSPTCPVVISLNKSLVLPAAQEVTKVISQSILSKIPGVPFYVRFRATADVEISFSEPEIPEDEQACQDATLLDWTDTINLSGLSTGWYKFDLTELHANPGNFTLKLNNDLGYATYLGLELYETCETGRVISIGDSVAEGLHIKSVTYSELTTLVGGASMVYAYISIGSKPVPPVLVEGCETAIEYVWGDDIQLNAGDDKWYKLALEDLKDKTCNITLTANNASVDTVRAALDMYSGCPVTVDNEIMSMTVGINPNTISSQTISSTELPDDVDTVYLHVEATGAVTVNMIVECLDYAYDTIASYGCVDAQQMWNDTVHVSAILDSVYTYIVNPFEAPVAMTDSILATITGAMPELKQGVAPDMTESANAIKAYYQSIDTEVISDVVSVTWEATTVDCNSTTHTITLFVVDTCNRKFETVHSFSVTPKPAGAVTEATICVGDSYVWWGKAYDTKGSYTYTVKDVDGCDSVLTLNLNVLEPVDSVDTVTICYGDSYVWAVNGKSYNQTDVDTVIVRNSLLCDSIYHILDLTVLPEIPMTYIDAVACDSYVLNGIEYVASGDYVVDTLAAINGCDSVVTLRLTINKSTSTEVYDTIYVLSSWNGQVYTTSGNYTYVDTLVTINGCDSIVTSYLTVLDKTVVETTTIEFVCDGTEYIDPVTKEKHIISSLIPSTCAWSDTIVGVATDSIYHFVINPIVAPEVMTNSTLASINAIPVLVQGEKPQVAASIAAIEAYYVANDTESISDVVSVVWSDTVNTLACDATKYTMTLTVEAGCDNVLVMPFEFDVQSRNVVEDVLAKTLCYGKTYTWVDGNVYSATGQYRDTVKTAFGCDSIIRVLDLTVLPQPTPIETNATVCFGGSYYWDGDGESYSNDTTVSVYYQDVNGCDSILKLNLTVVYPVATEETAVACGSYAWNDTTYTTSGDYTYTTVGANGCDSVVTLHLTIKQPITVEVTEVACGSYAWNDTTYTTSGDYTYTTVAANGCDSTITLHLTIEQPVTVEVTEVACGSYAWNDTTYTTSGDYTYTTVGANGCDSTTILHLTINLPVATEFDVTTCGVYTWNGNDYNVSGDYTQNYTAVNGCDSVVTLHLTILPDAVTEPEELVICESEFPYVWRGETLTAVGTYTVVEQYAGTTCDSVIHELTLQTYVMTLPANVALPIAVCGNPVDVTDATADIEDHIASTNLYAPNAVVTWYVNGQALTNDPIKGGVTDITAKYVITSDCGSIESTEFVVTVEAPTPENDVDMDNILVVSKYENRVFLLHLNDFESKFGWIPAPEEVTWYKVVGDVDTYGVAGDDIVVGTGHSYNEPDGSTIQLGDYYALIIRTEVENPDDCHTVMRSLVLSSAVTTASPQLVANVVRPSDDLTLINLNAEEITEIYVYDMVGKLVDTYIVDQASEFVFDAARMAGYYLVEVQTSNTKTTLRYIVK